VASIAMSNEYSTVSLFEDSEFEVLRSCAQECIWGTCCISVADFIGCPSPWYNQCVCNLNQQSSAAAHVSTCVVSRCTGNTDVSTAVAVYLDYCASAGYSVSTAAQASSATMTINGSASTAPKSNPTVATSAATTSPNNPPTTAPTAPTETPNNTSQGSGSGGYSISDKIALGVGIGIGIPSLLVSLLACFRKELRSLSG
jgi:hypothetical protein